MENNKKFTQNNVISRRDFIQNCTLGGIFLATGSLMSCLTTKGSTSKGAAGRNISLNQGWLFGGQFEPSSLAPKFDDSGFSRINLPHCVTDLSWQDWEPEQWQDVWSYRRHFSLPRELKDLRIFLHFDGVMVGASPVINGHELPPHLGGYLPFNYEITEQLEEKENVLAVAVDSRWSNVPPQGSSRGLVSVDYLEAGGIHRSVYLKAVPQIFISDVFAKPVKVLEADRRVDISCSVDAAILPDEVVEIQVEMMEGDRVVSSARKSLRLEKTGQVETSLSLSDLEDITLWDVDNPHLYDIVTTLIVEGKPLHNHTTRIGLRDARFELDGFFLNGRRLQLFGLNRHEIYPYVGFAMPERVMRRDAEILRNQFNCNVVRCSHYPQNEAFLNACDELGLLVWEEVPGWQYIGDAPWKKLLMRDVRDMVIRDRNHPSIIIWGTRVNESDNNPELYRETKALAKSLDDSRPSSGSMHPPSRKNWKEEWNQDVFAYDDYHLDPDGGVGIMDPVEGVPYMLSEAVGQFDYTDGHGFSSIYRRTAELGRQQKQALWHAEAHHKAASTPRNCGLIAWCGFEYASFVNHYRGVKYPGVADIFRIPKLGASFYETQGDPKDSGPVIQPNFYWDFGPKSPNGPGENVAIFSNCDRLELFIDDKKHDTVYPDAKKYSNLKHPPFFTDLKLDGNTNPILRIDGYVDGDKLISRSFSSDSSKDQLLLKSDDVELIGNGSDATRVFFRIVDEFGAARPFIGGEVNLSIDGPGVIVGDNPFQLKESGGAGAVWIKTIPNRTGKISLKATHPLGTKNLEINVKASM